MANFPFWDVISGAETSDKMKSRWRRSEKTFNTSPHVSMSTWLDNGIDLFGERQDDQRL